MAVLEYPAGWSRNQFFTLAISQPGLEPRTERVECDSPAAARAGAMERQRQALADGWIMGTVPIMQVDRSIITLYRNGQRIEGDVVKADVDLQGSPMLRERQGRTVIDIVCERAPAAIGDRIVVRREFRTVRSQWAMTVDDIRMAGRGEAWRVAGPVVEVAPDDSFTIDREAAIQAAVAEMSRDGGYIDPLRIWQMLGPVYDDGAERQRGVDRVVQLVQQRRAAAAQAEQAEREVQRRRLAEQMLASGVGVAQPAGIMRPGRHNIPQAQPTADEAIKRLSGGQLPGVKHKRRINLGE